MDYPSQLPPALLIRPPIQVVSPLLRTQLASGRARQRVLFDSVPAASRLEWIFTIPQSQLFELWFRYGIENGSKWFEMPLKTAMGFETELVRFTDIYTGPQNISTTRLRYSAEVEIFERRTLPETDLQFPDDIINSELFDYTMNKHWPKA